MKSFQTLWRACTVMLAIALGGVAPRVAHAGDVNLSLYGHIGYNAEVDGLGSTRNVSNTFYDSQADVFLHGAVDRLSFLSEIVLEVNNGLTMEPLPVASNNYAIDVERIIIYYQILDNLRVAAGRFHNAIGYYNDAYHHGTYYLMTTRRPLFVQFEDSGGLIESHGVGVHLDGRIPLSETWRLRYDVEVTNGRGLNTEVVNVQDLNNDKAFNLRLRVEPGGELDGLVFGANVYLDTIPNGLGGAFLPMDEQAYGAHIAYLENGIHFISELMYFRHEEQLPGTTIYETLAWFAELGYSFGQVTPYLRYEHTSFKDELIDGFFAAGGGGVGSYQIAIAGLNYLASENIAMKGQIGWRRLHSGLNSTIGEVQCAFGF